MKRRQPSGLKLAGDSQLTMPKPPTPQQQAKAISPPVQTQKLKVTSVSSVPRTQSLETKAKYEYKGKKKK